jgi:hypothetical protein
LTASFAARRKNTQSQLAQHGFRLDVEHGGELPQALSAEVLGMAFEDFEHNRGSGQVTTLWELHPATVNLRPEPKLSLLTPKHNKIIA